MSNRNPNTLLLAGLLYGAYCAATNYRSAVTGAPLPSWDEAVKDVTKPKVIEGWEMVAKLVASEAYPVHIVPGQPFPPDDLVEMDASGAPRDRFFQELEDKALRQNIEKLVNFLQNSGRKSAERTLAMRALQQARHWLGEDLHQLGTKYPYPKGNDATQLGVDPRADVPQPAAS